MTEPQKIVTHADRGILRDLRDNGWSGGDRINEIIDALIDMADADLPPLPEGWVRYDLGSGERYLHHRAGVLYVTSSPDSSRFGDVTPQVRRLLSPLCPAVTEDVVEKAAKAAAEESTALGRDVWHAVPESTQDLWKAVARAVLKTAGMEVAR